MQVEESKRKAGLSKEDGRAEAQAEVTAARGRVQELEGQVASLSAELGRVKEEQGGVAGRLAGALQSAQVRVGGCWVWAGEGEWRRARRVIENPIVFDVCRF